MACNSREEQNGLQQDIDANCSKSEINLSENSRSVDFMSEIENEISNFYNDVHKILKEKRKILEEFTKETIRRSAERATEENKNIRDEKKKLVYGFRRNFFSLISECEIEEEKLKQISKGREGHHERKKIEAKFFQLSEALQSLINQFCEDANNLERDHLKVYQKINDELQHEVTRNEERICLGVSPDKCAEAP